MVARFVLSCIAAAVLGLGLSGCGQTPPQGPVVLAAASLSNAMEDVADAWEAQGHARPNLSFAGTPALARQVEAGAAADLVVFADTEWMDHLADRSLIDPASRKDLLGNSLVVVRPLAGAGPGAVVSLADLGSGRIALAEPDSVPAGRYARAALESMGLWRQVERNIVPAENVRAALALVERGEVELGIVYASDAKASTAVRPVMAIPARYHPPIRYPAARIAGSTHPDGAAFLAFLSSDQAIAILAAHGFDPLP